MITMRLRYHDGFIFIHDIEHSELTHWIGFAQRYQYRIELEAHDE